MEYSIFLFDNEFWKNQVGYWEHTDLLTLATQVLKDFFPPECLAM